MTFKNKASKRSLRMLLGRKWSTAAQRPLQIHELAQAAEEHMRAASMPSLGARYLPTCIEFRVSEADWRSLRPFEQHLEAAIHEVFARLAAKPRFAAARERPEVVLFPAPELAEGASPVVSSSFGAPQKRASWRPGQRKVKPRGGPKLRTRVGGKPASGPRAPSLEPSRLGDSLLDLPLPGGGSRVEEAEAPEASPGAGLPLALELVATPFAGQGTARQSAIRICLSSELPLDLVSPGAEPGRFLTLADLGDGDEDGVEEALAESLGSKVETLPPLEASQPLDLEPGLGGAPGRLELSGPAFLLRGASSLPVIWAPGGVLVLGRDRRRCHWAPSGAPANLSGRHLALARGADGGLWIVDLHSTNGSHLDGETLDPLQPSPAALPASLEIGHEGALRLEITSLVEEPVRAPAEVVVRSARETGTVQEALDHLVLR